MHEGLIHGPVTQVLRKGEVIHGDAYTQWGGGGGGGGGLTGRGIRYIIRSLLSQLLTVLCLFKKLYCESKQQAFIFKITRVVLSSGQFA